MEKLIKKKGFENMKRIALLFTSAIIIALLCAGCNNKTNSPEYTVIDNGTKIITENSAKKVAAEKANLNLDDIQYTNISIDGRSEYDVEFIFDGYKYSIELDAVTGNIIKYSKEIIDNTAESFISDMLIESVQDVESTEHVESFYQTENESEDILAESSDIIEESANIKEESSDIIEESIEISESIESSFEDSIESSEVIIESSEPSDESQEIVVESSEEIIESSEEIIESSEDVIESSEIIIEDNESLIVDTDESSNTIPEIPSVESSNIPVITEKVAIGEEAALEAALNRAELYINADELEFCKIKFEKDKNDFEYDIEFIFNGVKYDVTVNAENGDIIEFESERIEHENDKPIESPKEFISEDEVLRIALEHAKLTRNDITDLRISLDDEDGKIEYEIEFISGYDEYDYDIDAVNGEIRNFDRDAEHCSAPEISTPEADEFVSENVAKNAAFAHAGIKPEDAREVEIELDEHRGKFIYELEFSCGRYEYEYDIDAFTGEVIRGNREYDD